MQEDTQKRMLIFFVAVSILVVSFSFFSSYLFPQPKEDTENKQKTTAQTSQAVQKN